MNTPFRVGFRTALIGPVIAAVLSALAGCAGGNGRAQSKTDFVLDTACTITLYDRAPASVLTDAFRLLTGVNDRMTMDGSASELVDVNGAAGKHAVEVTNDVYGVIKEGIHYSELTGGAFDITVGPLVRLWGIGRGGSVVPDLAAIERALSLIDYRDVVLDEATHSVYLTRAGMVIDLGGIAKGYAGEAVSALLRSEGVGRAIIDLGGNIVAMGSRPDGSPWRIGIQDPNRSRGSYVGVVSVVDKAVVTSGKYERYFDFQGKRYHHILSTKTGFPIENGIESVSIVSADSMTADALSTSLFLLGVREGIELIDSLEDTEAIIFTEDRKVYVSEGLRGQFRITDPEYTLAPPVGATAGKSNPAEASAEATGVAVDVRFMRLPSNIVTKAQLL